MRAGREPGQTAEQSLFPAEAAEPVVQELEELEPEARFRRIRAEAELVAPAELEPAELVQAQIRAAQRAAEPTLYCGNINPKIEQWKKAKC